MGEKGISEHDLNVMLREYRNRNLPDYVLKVVEADLKSGLSKKQIASYTGRRLKECNVKAMSEALHRGISPALVSKLARINEYKLAVFLEELRGGMSEDRILEVIGREENAHGMKELFSQVKENIARTEDNTVKEDAGADKKEQPEESRNDESIKDEGNDDVSNSEDNDDVSSSEDNREGNNSMDPAGYKPEDIAKAMEPVLAKFTESLTEALKPGIDYMNRLVDGISVMKPAVPDNKENGTEDRLNAEIDRMEKQIGELQNDLASSAGVIKNRENEIARLKEEMEKMKAMERENVTKDNVQVDVDNNPDRSNDSPVIPGNCQTVLRTADGKEITVHIERMEAKRPRGMLAMAARLFGGTESQKSLLNMLIDRRLSPEQLREIKRAKDNNFDDGELKDLIESELPAEEMSGIIDVIISDRK